jgi:uncharacterized protein with NAD-binding domain and iron-sulfur cluster
MPEPKTRVAIIGGGCAGLTTAFELTRPELQGRYAVTVYQLGWRLGGKGASGRGVNNRIEEHGLHLWMGFYENAFQLMRDCYEELGRDPATCRFARWSDAFVPDNVCGVMDCAPDGTWSPWLVHFPPMPGEPGDPGTTRWTVMAYLQRAISLARTLLGAIQGSGAGSARVDDRASPGLAGLAPSDVIASMWRLMTYGGLAGLSGLIQGLGVLDEVSRMLPRLPTAAILSFHAAIADSARTQIGKMTHADPSARRLWEVVELVLATIRGIVSHGLVTDPRGFDAIDDYDCREWLRLNGASERACDSAFLRALYDLAFAYEEGDTARPRIAAGQALRGAVRAFFTYRGAFFWKMQTGMGDAVFAPLYEVLKRRGVEFEFFHRLENVRLGQAATAGSSGHVSHLDFSVQAKVRSDKAYQPLIDVKGLPCWPSMPDWTQLVEGRRLKREGRRFESYADNRREGQKTLKVGEDFDFAVLAVGIGAVPLVCRELVEQDARWRTMIENVKSVPTQALQLWLSEDIEQLGWRGPSVNISGYVEPFDTWADMPQLITEESFSEPVKAIAYFCSVLPDVREGTPGDYDSRHAEVRLNAIRFLESDLPRLWPRAVHDGGGFRWDLLVGDRDPGKIADASRIDSQYLRANIEPSDRYTLSLPRTSGFRISPLDAAYDNLSIAGDWTACGFIEGCVEAAVMSGRLAAHALCREPRLEDIIGYDHP